MQEGAAFSKQRLTDIQDDDESIYIAPVKKALILAPFQHSFGKNIEHWKEQLRHITNDEPYVFLDGLADITKFKGEFLKNHDLILIDTHGMCGACKSLTSTNEDRFSYKRTERFTTALASGSIYTKELLKSLINETGMLSWDQIILAVDNGKTYFCMDKSLIEGYSFDGKIVLLTACQSAKDQTSSTSLMKAFIDNGADICVGFNETVNSSLAGVITNGLLCFLSHGVSFEDFNNYWIPSEFVTELQESGRDCEFDKLEEVDPELYTYQVQPKLSNSKIFLKNPYPSLNPYIIDNDKITFEWNTELEKCSTIAYSIFKEKGKFYTYSYDFTFNLISNLLVDGKPYKRINDSNKISLPVNEFSSGEHRWQISCSLEDFRNNIVCTYSSNEEKFIIPEPIHDLVISQYSVELDARTTKTVEIISGSGNYTVSVDPPTYAAASLDGSVITIKGLKEGPAVVTVEDKVSHQTADIKVTVNAPDPSADMKTFTVNGVSFTMVNVEGATYYMGANTNDNNAESLEKPRHLVSLSNYYIGQTEVTQELWTAVMGSNPSKFTDSDQLPVDCVTWNDCQDFVTKLNELTGEKFRLPTEAEWEFAARGGMKTKNYKYSGSDNIDEVAWYKGNAGDAPHPVATKAPNELGLYDMSGNSRELVSDWYGNYQSTAQVNPTGPSTGTNKVERGGSWYHDAKYCRISSRYYSKPTDKFTNVGFRIALSSNNDERFDQIIPEEVLEQIEKHMPIFDGSNPPNIEGEYLVSPWVLTYDVENQFEVGHTFNDLYLKLYNQDMVNNTLDYIERQSSSDAIGTGSFISGDGTHFTVYFTVEGISRFTNYDINWKEALMISGTKIDSGIGNFFYGFVMLEKSDDPERKLVDVGHYRVIKDKDGTSPYYNWYSGNAPKRIPAVDWSLPGSNEADPR